MLKSCYSGYQFSINFVLNTSIWNTAICTGLHQQPQDCFTGHMSELLPLNWGTVCWLAICCPLLYITGPQSPERATMAGWGEKNQNEKLPGGNREQDLVHVGSTSNDLSFPSFKHVHCLQKKCSNLMREGREAHGTSCGSTAKLET